MQPQTLIKADIVAGNVVHIEAWMAKPFQCDLPIANKEHGRHVIADNAKDVLWYHIEKYINHSKILMRHSTYSTKAWESMGRCEDFLKWINENPNNCHSLVQYIPKMFKHLHAILPHQNNPSYDSSLVKLNSIMITVGYLNEKLWQTSM